MTSMIKTAGRNLVAIIGLFAVFLPAFIACTTLFSVGAGLLVLFVGLFVLVACLVVAGWSAQMTRSLLGVRRGRAAADHLPGAWHRDPRHAAPARPCAVVA